MKKIRPFLILLCLIVALQCAPGPVYADPGDPSAPAPTSPPLPVADPFSVSDASVQYGCHTPDARQPIAGEFELLTFSEGAALYEVQSETLVYTWNADKQFFPSSLVKIMTALIALENANVTDQVTATAAALNAVSEEALRADILVGEVMTLEQLMGCMLVGGANDAAAILADHVAGSQEYFVQLMNQRARELGCTGTHFTNSTGLHHNNQLTTARDVIKILREALKHQAFKEYFGMAHFEMPATNMSGPRDMWTTNYMLCDEDVIHYIDSRVTGGRTGVTDLGFRCFVVTADIKGGTYIAVTLESLPDFGEDGSRPGSHGSYVDTGRLLDLVSGENVYTQVLSKDQILGQLEVEGGSNDIVVGTDEAVFSVLPGDLDPNWMTTRIKYDLDTVTAPVEAGVKYGVCQIWYGSICLTQVNLYSINASRVVENAPPPTAPPEDPGFDAGAVSTALMVLGILFLCILVMGGGLFLVRYSQIFMRNSRSKKRRKERRRSR